MQVLTTYSGKVISFSRKEQEVLPLCELVYYVGVLMIGSVMRT